MAAAGLFLPQTPLRERFEARALYPMKRQMIKIIPLKLRNRGIVESGIITGFCACELDLRTGFA